MIDVEKLQRAVDATEGDVIVVRKTQLSQMFAEIVAGQAAQRALVNLRSIATVAAATAGLRVSGGYPAPDAPASP